MIAIEGLRYVRLGVTDLAGASDFATRIVGLERAGGSTETVALFRSDFRDHTLDLFEGAAADQTLAMEVRSVDALKEAASQLVAEGYVVITGDAETCKARRCKAMISIAMRIGLTLEFVVRPQHSGWRYFPTRDAGIAEFFGVALASTDVVADTDLFTRVLGGRITDYLGDAVYIAFDEQHHRIAIHPSTRDGLLEVQFKVEGMHELMQNNYFLQSSQVPIAHGPGRRAASEQVFLTFKGLGGVLFGYVAEGIVLQAADKRLPRQFPRSAASFCTWGSVSHIPEFSVEPVRGDST